MILVPVYPGSVSAVSSLHLLYKHTRVHMFYYCGISFYIRSINLSQADGKFRMRSFVNQVL